MLGFEDDMRDVFFGSDFAGRVCGLRAGAVVGEVAGILGIADDQALEGRVVAAARTLRYPASIQLRVDDIVECLDAFPMQNVAAGTRFRVLEVPKRVNDGAEMEALLGSVSP